MWANLRLSPPCGRGGCPSCAQTLPQRSNTEVSTEQSPQTEGENKNRFKKQNNLSQALLLPSPFPLLGQHTGHPCQQEMYLLTGTFFTPRAVTGWAQAELPPREVSALAVPTSPDFCEISAHSLALPQHLEMQIPP